jgi:hypothetical protein
MKLLELFGFKAPIKPRILNPKFGFLIQTGNANVWDHYINTDFMGALCTNGYTRILPDETGTDHDSYLQGVKNLMGQGADVIITAGKLLRRHSRL